MTRRAILLITASAVAIFVAPARATAPPVGPLPRGPVTTITVQQGLVFALALPRPGKGLTWRGARNTDVDVARPLNEGELNGRIVFTYRAAHRGTTTIAYALTQDETPRALQARYFRIVAFHAPARAADRLRCSALLPLS